ncbi:HTH-type transcriptional regulator AscG [Clostridiales bacterium CHKCI006]|nr:HTH-type transcriptional regulator AscG [Clostridiales bacterium CHKCI006]
MASIKDIAKALGLSVSTVSLALNDKPRVSKETRDLVKAKAKELKYVKSGIAADLQRKRTNLILFIVNDASRSFFSTIINHLQRATSAFGYDFLICTTYGNHNATAERFIKEHRADAIIIYTSTVADDLIIENAREDFPIVVLGREVTGDYVYCYNYSNTQEPLSTTEYMISQGLRKIAFVKGSSASLGTSRTFNKYKKSLEDHQIPLNQNWIFDAGGSSYRHGYEITEKMIPIISEIDAIQYSTDDIAIGGMLCLKEHGIHIPEDISIAGKGNIPESNFISPSLTTSGATKEAYLFYEGLVHYLILMIEKSDEYAAISMQLAHFLSHFNSEEQLIIRESVKKSVF